jgi:hypothetical protein
MDRWTCTGLDKQGALVGYHHSASIAEKDRLTSVDSLFWRQGHHHFGVDGKKNRFQTEARETSYSHKDKARFSLSF